MRGPLVPSGVFEGDPVNLVCPRPGRAIAANRTQECRVHCQQGATEQRQPVDDDFRSLVVEDTSDTEVQLSGKRFSAPFHLLLDRRGPLRSPKEIPYARESQQLRMPTCGGPSRRRDGHMHERAVK